MTIKDIDRMGNLIRGNVEYYAEVETPHATNHLWFKTFDSLRKYVKKYYTDDLVSKEDPQKRIVGVKIFRS